MKNIRNRNIFLDANVIIDYVLDRKYNTNNANALFEYAQKLSVRLYICSYTFAIAYHYLRDANVPHNQAINTLERLFQEVKSLPVDDVVIKQSMESDFRDFEDAIQYYCALQINKCEVIITRNPKDFVSGNIPVTTPQKFLTHLLKD